MSGLFGGGQSNSQVQDRMNELRLQTSSYGQPVPVVYGKTRVPSNVIYHTDFTAIPHTTTQRTGKGGGGSTSTNTSYTYTAAVMLALCEGPVTITGKVWRDKEVFQSPGALGLTILEGNITQAPWTYLTSMHPTEAVGYGSTAYAASSAMDLGESGTLKNHSFEVKGFFATATATHDANPADVLYDMLTHPIHGAGWSASALASLLDYRNYCIAAGIYVSPCYSEQRTMVDHLQELLDVTNSGVVWSGGKLRIVPLGDTPLPGWTPVTAPAYDLTNDDFLVSGVGDDPIKITRKSQADAYNALQLEYQNRDKDYAEEVVEASDLGNQELFGIRPASPFKAKMLASPSVARNVVQLMLQRMLYLRNEYEFKLGWRYALLEPLDLVTLTDTTLGLNRTAVRLLDVDEDEDGGITCRAIEWPFGVASATSYPNPGGLGPNTDWNASASFPIITIAQMPREYANGVEGLVIAAAPDSHDAGAGGWGGCHVYASRDNLAYTRIGQITIPATMGALYTGLPTGDPFDYADTCTIELHSEDSVLQSISTADWNRFSNLALVGNASYGNHEIVSFQNAVLSGGAHYPRYSLSNIRRALYGTTGNAHTSDEEFTMLDSTLMFISLNDWEWEYGDVIYFKFTSWNKYGLALQSLADVPVYVRQLYDYETTGYLLWRQIPQLYYLQATTNPV